MRLILRKYCSKVHPEIYPYSTVKIIKSNKSKTLEKIDKNECVQSPPNIAENPFHNDDKGVETEYRENEVKIQMLSNNLYKQIFGFNSFTKPNESVIKKSQLELQKHGIQLGENPKLDDVILKLPKLQGKNIEEHFATIAKEQIEPYQRLLSQLLCDIPEPPKEWNFTPGLTCYGEDGSKIVDYPEEDALVFDVEVCLSAGSGPIIACAVGKKFWYSWTSPQLINEHTTTTADNRRYTLDDMITFGKKRPKIIIGHNVSFDRARIREQYLLEDTGTRFMDTMSLHVCVSGITSYQRAMLKSNKEFDEEDLSWSTQSSLNNLMDVYRLYCNKELQKEPREMFVSGSLNDIRNNFQYLMDYCANDVKATHEVFRTVYPLFEERFPHPATLAGMLEIGSAYLPVNSNWNRYIEECNLAYEDLDIESRYHLAKRADEACQLMDEEKYKQNLWMWDQDWSTQTLKMKKTNAKIKKLVSKNSTEKPLESIDLVNGEEIDPLQEKFQYLYETKNQLPSRRPLLPGYPAWYRKLCSKPDAEDWSPGAINISTGMQVTPKLLALCWEGYPLHYLKDHGWGFLVPFRKTHPDNEIGQIPIKALVEKCPVIEIGDEANSDESSYALNSLWRDVETNISKKDYYRKTKKDKASGNYTGTGVWCNVILEGCCWFIKLPHKNGPSYRVGNPLAKDFLNKFSSNVLSSGDGDTSAERVIEIAKMLSYWRNNRERINNQLVTWLPRDQLPRHLRNSEMEYGAIIPQIVVCGTLTRRAMEPTWMTASNAQKDRVGSELRAMVQAPKGYKFVGADVDSQELWIASVLGDAYATAIHGGTPLGWMTLSGTKSSGTDMHSVTAKAVGISRDHAKVINYARIYGAGQNFAETLLKQFNPTISDGEARSKATKMFNLTKGKKVYYLLPDYEVDGYENKRYSTYEALKMAAAHGKSVSEMFQRARWEGGTESAMFNRLEEIAESENAATPFLSGRLSRALEPKKDTNDRFLPTRVNWVVQSGAVDFLHLMLVCMRWLMGNHIRFCLSFHDEIRYTVKEELVYKAALAMHVTNLLTRSFCVHRIGLTDLPMSIAFFSSVDVDSVLRKDGSMDCKTPSNPHGLQAGYNIPNGESLNIYDTLKKIGSSDMSKWEWHMKKTRKIISTK